jgi:hypothetical protein
MKYILLMSGTKAGVEGYHAWSKQDIDAHMAVLHRINKELADSGEFVATQRISRPNGNQNCTWREKRPPGHRRHFPRVEGISFRLLDRRRCQRRARVCRSGADFRSSRTRGQTHKYADRSAAVRDVRFQARMIEFRESAVGSDLLTKARRSGAR